MDETSDVCVIGGGLTGILAVKYCLEYNLDVVCYEERSRLGGLWTGADPQVSQIGPDGEPRVAVYQSLVMNISRTLTAFSDFPLPESVLPKMGREERFLTGAQFLKYLDLFVHKFGIDRCVQLSSQVLQVTKSTDSDHPWGVTVRQKDREKELVRTTHHNYVIVASGLHSEAFIPEIPGIQRTPVHVVHTGFLRTLSDLRNKRVLVVGDSISAGDMAEAAVRAGAEKVMWAAVRDPLRSVLMMKLRPFSEHQTWDECFSLFSYRHFPAWLMRRFVARMVAFAYRCEAGTDLNMARDRFTVQDTSVIDAAVRAGQLEILPASIRSFCEERPQAELSNGTTVTADVCVLGTGYRTRFPFLSSVEVSELHRHMVPLEPSLRGLAFLYTTGVSGGGFCGPEMEARWLVHQIANGRLSSAADLGRLVGNSQWNGPILNEGRKRPAFTIVENLASDLGCEPHFLWAAFLSPCPHRRRLGLAVAFGPWLPQLYRLRGPHAKPREVEDIIISTASSVRGWKFGAFAITVDVAHKLARFVATAVVHQMGVGLKDCIWSPLRWAKSLWS